MKKIGTPACWVCGDNDVDAEQWREMVKHWDKEKTTVSDINTPRKDLVVKYFLYILLNQCFSCLTYERTANILL